MRAREFLKESDSDKPVTINISITLPSGMNGKASVTTDTNDADELPEQPVQVFPLQQELELKKYEAGLRSPVLNQILQDKGAYSDVDDVDGEDLKEDYDLDEDYLALQEAYKLAKLKRRQ